MRGSIARGFISLRWAAKRGAVAAFAYSVSVAACGRIAGIDDYGVTTPAEPEREIIGECGAFVYAAGASACRDCIDADPVTCDAARGCLDDGTCHSLWGCFLRCSPGDADCRGRCASGNYRGIRSPAGAVLANAVSSRCHEACNLGCSNFQPKSCNECLDTHCCSIYRANLDDLEALHYGTCGFRGLLASDGIAIPPDDCDNQPFSAGRAKYEEARECFVKSNCGEICLGPDFSCAGHVEWPDASQLEPAPISFHLRLVDPVGGVFAPVSKVGIRACGLPDGLDCVPIRAGDEPRVTDTQGRVRLDFAEPLPLQRDYFGFLEATLENGDSRDQGLFYVFPPPRHTSGVALPFQPGAFDDYTRSPTNADPEKGIVVAVLGSCSTAQSAFLRTPGLTFAVPTQPDADICYLRNSACDRNLKHTDDAFSPAAVAVDIGEGRHTLRSCLGSQLIAEVSDIVVRAKTVTVVMLPPTPLSPSALSEAEPCRVR